MQFHKIDRQTWARQGAYQQFMHEVPCTYSLTVQLDVTRLLAVTKAQNLKFFPCLLHAVGCVVNWHSAFRMDLNAAGELGYYDTCNPCYTVFHPETETFTNVWSAHEDDLHDFLQNYTQDMQIYQPDATQSKPMEGNHIFYVSALPWTNFTAFHLNLQKGYDCFQPVFTLGKYITVADKTTLPLAIQVHHAVCDGYHVAKFLTDLQQHLDDWA